ncbi:MULTISPECIES: hypothetical protein [Anaeromyxobacter]|uniref:hypothetical protein n=1 Tax=Anaeromyxobacter TaxID=161492 RepID=UPI001F56D2EA|nr:MULTISPECIES: hypothetical protein [unclassified Anaeromyxobacter]
MSFASGSFVYDHSDVSESGTYTCSGLTVTGRSGGRTFAGVFDPACQVLTWDGVTYARFQGH